MPENKEDKQEFKLENLVILQFSQNICYTQVVDASSFVPTDPKLKIDIENGEWTYQSSNRLKETNKIGGARYFERGSRGGVIGVYDRTNTQHLSLMVSAGKEATRSDYMYDIDD